MKDLIIKLVFVVSLIILINAIHFNQFVMSIVSGFFIGLSIGAFKTE